MTFHLFYKFGFVLDLFVALNYSSEKSKADGQKSKNYELFSL